MSQEELAHISGYHRNYFGILERGEKSPSLRTLFNLAGALTISPSEILRRVERSLKRKGELYSLCWPSQCVGTQDALRKNGPQVPAQLAT
jgi:transcriptional regulator with XRE-family HTH domain